MILLSSPAELSSHRQTCLTLGNFDGVHIGHQALLAKAREMAENAGLLFLPVTFYPHPADVLHPGQSAKNLTTREEKLELFEAAQVSHLLEMPFTMELAALSPAEFITRWLLPLHPARIVIGHDFRFGHQRAGDLSALSELGKAHNFTVTRVAAFMDKGFPVSSSRIRKELLSGNMREAARLLGHPFSIAGIVEHGFERGRSIGFPTANIAVPPRLLPSNGVYATLAQHKDNVYPAVTNIGLNPTFGGQKITVESFLLDASLDLYGENLKIQFVEKLRNEKKFPDADALKRQIKQDITDARKIFLPV